MRGFIWGAVAGLALTVFAGNVAALVNGHWPYHHGKGAASQSTMHITRIAAPFGALLGGLMGLVIQKPIRARETRRRLTNEATLDPASPT